MTVKKASKEHITFIFKAEEEAKQEIVTSTSLKFKIVPIRVKLALIL
jgi:hypothetical protein